MKEQYQTDYDRIAAAIGYLREHYPERPTLDDAAAHVCLSPSHFQRMFTQWAGVSPKKFVQYLSVGYAKQVLRSGEPTLFDAACATGLSGTGRLHDLFVTIEGMTPAEYRDGGAGLPVNYSFRATPFGDALVASTTRGVCYLAFADDHDRTLDELHAIFPRADYREQADALQLSALSFFDADAGSPKTVRLHLKGTPFQLKVWDALLRIPEGKLTTYGDLAREVGSPRASRAVGSAVGDNPVSALIPCHRVIRSSGALGGYHWGLTRKLAMIGWEAARTGDDKR